MPVPARIDNETAGLLRRVLRLDAFYPDLDAAKLQSLFPKSGLYQFQLNERVILEGSVSRNIYILQDGRVRVTKKEGGKDKELAVLGPGSMFGEIALINPDGIRTASVTTVLPSRIYYLIVDDVKRVMQASAALGEHLLALAGERLGRQNFPPSSAGTEL